MGTRLLQLELHRWICGGIRDNFSWDINETIEHQDRVSTSTNPVTASLPANAHSDTNTSHERSSTIPLLLNCYGQTSQASCLRYR